MQIRYIRDWTNNNTFNNYNYWIEIQAFQGATNVALNKTTTASDAVTYGSISCVTDGNTATTSVARIGGENTTQWVMVDLGTITEIDKIIVWHYWDGGLTFHHTKTEVSTDGTNWTTVFDSAVSGEYLETSTGHTIIPAVVTNIKKYLIKSGGNIYTVVNNAPSQITGTLSAAIFQQYGVDSVSSSALLALPNPSVLYWQSSSTEPLAGVYATVAAIPFPQTVVTYETDMSDSTIAGIKSITPYIDVTGNGTALFAISFDSGTTYNAYTGLAWQTVDITSTDDFIAKGMTAVILSAITQQQWSDFLITHTSKKYKISALLNRPSVDDGIRIKSIQTVYLNQ